MSVSVPEMMRLSIPRSQQVGREPAVMERRIDPFVEDHCRWHQFLQLGHQLEQLASRADER